METEEKKKYRAGFHVCCNEEDEKLIQELQDVTGLPKAMIFKLGLRSLKNNIDLIRNSTENSEGS